MFKIRRNTFETNSSSTHSITMCSKCDYDRWCKENLYLCDIRDWRREKLMEKFSKLKNKNNMFFTKDEVKDILKFIDSDVDFDNMDNETFDEYASDSDFYSCDRYNEISEDFEWFEDTYITEGGEEVIAFGYYGYDG